MQTELIKNRIFIVYVSLLTIFSCSSPQNEITYVKAKKVVSSENRLKNYIKSSLDLNKSKWLDSLLESNYEKRVFNGSILIAENGHVIYKNAYGYARFRTKEKINTQTSFQLASVSKIFTAIAVMMLEEQKKIKYDDDIKKYIRDFPYDGITVRNLLNHRSGLQNYIYVAENYRDRSLGFTNNDIMKMFVDNNIELEFKPGRRFKYCNTNYAILALLVEKVSKQPYDEFVKKNIFDVLGMNNSFVYNKSKFGSAKNYATGYRHMKRGYSEEIHDYLDGIVGDKGIYSTVEDLYNFDCALNTDKLVKQSTLKEAFFPGKNSKKNSFKDYGFGWRLKFVDGKKIVYHFGWWRGYRTYYLKIFEENLTIISLNNRDNISMNSLITKIVKYLKNLKEEPEIDENNDEISVSR
ncbi:MAG: serine hydrolase [Bacteroidales bacterium]|nr:serine hydrolase [Bacteroidales bacterium]